MDFIKKAAGDYMGNSGGQAGSGAGGGGGDWSALANLGSQMASHEEQTGGNTDFSHFTNMLTGGGTEDPKAKNADPSIINSLLGEFEQHTGQSFGGSDSDYSILSQLATDKTGMPFQQTILKKLVMWKMQSMF